MVCKVWLGLVLGFLSCASFAAEPLELDHIPLAVSESTPPNMVFSFDDSASMNRGYLPESLTEIAPPSSSAYKSASVNRLAYDPNKIYPPGKDFQGGDLSDADFNAAQLGMVNGELSDPYRFLVGDVGAVAVDLSINYRPPVTPVSNFWATDPGDGESGQRAYYYVRNEVCVDEEDLSDECFSKVVVSADEEQNFANWYQYYSIRLIAGKTAVSRAFDKLPPSARLARQTIKTRVNQNTIIMPFSQETGGREEFYNWLYGIDAFGGTPLREATQAVGEFFKSGIAYQRNPGGSDDRDKEELSCRRNYHIMFTDGYYSPMDSGAEANIGDVDQSSISRLPHEELDHDRSYNPNADETKIYGGAGQATLADITFKYWATDLKEDLSNNVTPIIIHGSDEELENLSEAEYWHPSNNPATWQHMVNFFIAFGVMGNVDPQSAADLESLINGDIDWSSPTPVEDNPSTRAAQIDDLLHAALNSRGKAYNAAEPAEFESALEDIIRSLDFQESSSSSVSVTSSSLLDGAEVYQAGFETRTWSGSLEAWRVSKGGAAEGCDSQVIGTLCGVSKTIKPINKENWRNRSVYSVNGAGKQKGIDLSGGDGKWSQLNGEQRAALQSGDSEEVGKQRLNYILGDASRELISSEQGIFRSRTDQQRSLGAVVHAAPVFVGNGLNADGSFRRFYPNWLSPAEKSYKSFVDGISARNNYVYVAANDGMLHGYEVNEDSPELTEKFAYIPAVMFDTLAEYTEPGFIYRPYVDGQLTEGDMFFDDAWHTVLAGAFRGGAKGIFALDITAPGSFGENKVLWEYSTATADDDDLGHVYGKINLIKTNRSSAGETARHHGDWLVATANGYNSNNGHAVLYFIDPEEGTVVKKIDTGIGPDSTEQSYESENKGANIVPAIPNGLSSPFMADVNRDFKVDYAYAGDLYGNMWRFDISSPNTDDWEAHLVYAATDEDDKPQSIMGRPVVNSHPDGLPGHMVYFGTGKYLEPEDNDLASAQVQTFYGIWDRLDKHSANSLSREQLLEQEIETQRSFNSSVSVRLVSDKEILYYSGDSAKPSVGETGVLGWYLEFDQTQGELIVGNPLLRAGNVIFTTIIPESDSCVSGGSSWLMELDARSGGPPPYQPFDNNNDRFVNSGDLSSDNITAGWQGKDTGIYTDPSIIYNPLDNLDLKVISTSSGQLVNVVEQSPPSSLGRKQWRKIR